MTRLLAATAAAAAVWAWWPFPAPGADPVSDLIAVNSPRLHAAIRTWHYLAPAVAVVMAWSVVVAVGRVWFTGGRRGRVVGPLPAWPVTAADPAPALVVGELHHPVADREVASPDWLVIPELGLYTGTLICGAIGSGKTSACMRPFARQLLGWQAEDRRRRAAGLVLEVKGDFCHQVRAILVEAGRGEDYVELGLGGRWQWNPLGDDRLDSYSLAYTLASLINQLFGRSKEPFWQQAYVNLVRWIIELHRMRPERWVTLRDVYRCTLEPKRIEELIAEVEARVEAPVAVRIASTDFAAQVSTLGAWSWKDVGGGRLRTGDDPRLREQLGSLGVAFEVEKAVSADPARWERLDAVRRWYHRDWKALDQKLRSSIVEGLSVFLSVFDLPDVAATFCPPKRPSPNDAPALREDALAVDGAPVARQLPRLDDVIDGGKVLALNMPAGTNSALSRAVGVMLKQAWLQTLLRRPAEMQAHPKRIYRPAVFLCDEYQTFATVGEDDPAGDEKAFALTRQSRLIPIVATQSISSLRAVLGQSEAWRALLQTLRTRIFLSLAEDSSAQIASTLCGQVAKMKASYSLSEQTSQATASLLTGAPGGGTGSLSASKSFSERREALFHPRDFTLLGNCQAIVLPYDGKRTLDARRCYLKPDFLPRDRPYWRAREAGEL
ncbi:MAG: type IV secretion system DNA-binding domain-containing protein [Acidobacteria bacterium]|nr:type IV secretion system DNA-binding domain-containing protein [Acidobacteriota bacterium]